MRKNCVTCKHDRLRNPICDECYNTSDAPTKWEAAEYYEPDTNADRIRASTDSELAEDIYAISLGYKPWCDCHCENQGDDGCDNCIEQWLQQPAEDK